MPIKIGLRDIFRTTDFRDRTISPLERIGALYYNRLSSEPTTMQQRILELLGSTSKDNPEEQMVALHGAIMLAQEGNFDGVAFLLDLLRQPVPAELHSLAATALRNCNQFPFAALIAHTFNLKGVEINNSAITELLHLGEEDLSPTQPSTWEWQNLLERITLHVQDLHVRLPPATRRLALCTVLTSPVRTEERYRYSGFVVIERDRNNPLVVPYDRGDILNADDSRASQDISQLLRTPGRRGVVVYAAAPPYEIHLLYLLPFPTVGRNDLQTLMGSLALRGEGLSIGIAIDVQQNGYRVITSDGNSYWETFKLHLKQIGSCVLYHPQNSRSLSTDLSVRPEDIVLLAQQFQQKTRQVRALYIKTDGTTHTFVCENGRIAKMRGADQPQGQPVAYVEESQYPDGSPRIQAFMLPGLNWRQNEAQEIISAFSRTTTLDRAIWIKSYGNQHTLISRQGNVATFYRDINRKGVYFLESGTNKDKQQTFYPFTLPLLIPLPAERAEIITGFFDHHPEAKGIMIRVFEAQNQWRAWTVHCASGEILRTYCGAYREPGTLVFCYPQDDHSFDQIELPDYRVQDACTHCHGSGQRVCVTCNCKGRITCSECNGRGSITCPEYACNDGNIPCGACTGSGVCQKCTAGYWRDGTPCPKCRETGRCPVCKPQGSGNWQCSVCRGRGTLRCGECQHGTRTCWDCNGSMVSRCMCGGSRGTIVASE